LRIEPPSTSSGGYSPNASQLSIDRSPVTDDVIEIERASRAFEAERLRRIAELDTRGSFACDGYLSMSAWLVHRLRIAWSTAGQHVRMARGLRRMPRTREALSAGDVSAAATSMLVSARETRRRPDRGRGRAADRLRFVGEPGDHRRAVLARGDRPANTGGAGGATSCRRRT
jgi:hypothetical protein